MIAQLNPAVRLIPPSEATGERWIAEDVLRRRRFRLSSDAAAALVAACRPREPERLARQLAETDGSARTDGEWGALIDQLHERSLIVDVSFASDDPDVSWLTTLRRSWSRYGWEEAAEYHTLTFDYPCFDYSEGETILADRGRMRHYQSAEPDTDRCKLDYLDRPEIPLAEPTEDLAIGTADDAWREPAEPARADFGALAKILALTFGATGTAYPVTDAAPLLLRASPSGGARHPSEGYVVVRDLPGIAAGWYHVTIRPFGLRQLDRPAVEDRSLRPLFPQSLVRSPFDPRALIVITSVFGRNMYRYREPRTFRTVHMDAGHLAGTACVTARSLGLSWAMFVCDDARGIESALGLDGMREGYMATVAIADGAARTEEGGS